MRIQKQLGHGHGFPRCWSHHELEAGRSMFATKRGKISERHLRALAAARKAYLFFDRLPERQRYLWLLDPEPRIRLLSELGLIEDERHLIDQALLLCTLQPTSRVGAKTVRNFRLGRRPEKKPVTVDEAAHQIAVTLDSVLEQQPERETLEVCLAALHKMVHLVERELPRW